MGEQHDGKGRESGLLGFLFEELRQAFQDIREKVVEEGWFGRVVTAAPVVDAEKAPASIDAREQSITFEMGWGRKPQEFAQPAHEQAAHERLTHEQPGHGMER